MDIQLDDKTQEKLNILSEHKGLTESSLILQIIDTYLYENEIVIEKILEEKKALEEMEKKNNEEMFLDKDMLYLDDETTSIKPQPMFGGLKRIPIPQKNK